MHQASQPLVPCALGRVCDTSAPPVLKRAINMHGSRYRTFSGGTATESIRVSAKFTFREDAAVSCWAVCARGHAWAACKRRAPGTEVPADATTRQSGCLGQRSGAPPMFPMTAQAAGPAGASCGRAPHLQQVLHGVAAQVVVRHLWPPPRIWRHRNGTGEHSSVFLHRGTAAGEPAAPSTPIFLQQCSRHSDTAAAAIRAAGLRAADLPAGSACSST